MRAKATDTVSGPTAGQRLTRGLTNTAAGPVDVARGVIGLGVQAARSGAAQVRHHYRESRLAREVAAAPEVLARELASAQEVLGGLPEALQQARRAQRRRSRRPRVIVLAAVGAAVLLAGGAAAFVLIRRSSRPEEPSRLPPSVDVQPRP